MADFVKKAKDDGLEQLYSKSKGKAEFLFVYIREAHPADSNWAIESDPLHRG